MFFFEFNLDPTRHRHHPVALLRVRRPRQEVPGVRRDLGTHHGLHQVGSFSDESDATFQLTLHKIF